MSCVYLLQQSQAVTSKHFKEVVVEQVQNNVGQLLLSICSNERLRGSVVFGPPTLRHQEFLEP